MNTRIGIYQVGNAVVDLHESLDGYSGAVYAGEFAWPFPEIADAITDATCCAEEAGEVEELDDLPEWCAEMEVADAR